LKNRYIVIEGNIGAGKTSLATMLSKDLGAELLLEEFQENYFLPKFYKEPEKFALPLELSFLTERYHQLKRFFPSEEQKSGLIVSDFYFYKSLLFAKINLPVEEFKLYLNVFNIIYSKLPKPDIFIYLQSDIQRILQNIEKRGRGFEKLISPSYLEKVQEVYLDYIKTKLPFPVLLLDSKGSDFVNSRKDYLKIIEAIETSFQ
jgi:deoxyguanosine kinase